MVSCWDVLILGVREEVGGLGRCEECMVLRELSRLGKHVLFVRVIEGKVVCTMIRCARSP